MKRITNKRGFSLIELLFATFLSVAVLATAVKAWTFLMYGYHKNSIQQELDIDVRMAMENFKQDLRLTSLDKVVFYPQGAGPYTALSFPKARDDDGDGLIDVDGDGNVIWDETVIYHIYSGSPNQLRRTSFDPRDNSLSDVQRYAQLANTVANGNGSGPDTTTRALFSNLFEWELEGKGAIFDGYSASIDRKEFIDLGSAMLDSGDHDITFRVLGKNSNSTGYNLGLDTMAVTSSRSTLQGEFRTVTAIGGGSYSTEYIEGGSWSDNNHLLFDAGAVGDLITLGVDNDCWEETVFTGDGSNGEGALVEYDQGFYPSTYVVRLPGDDFNWKAADQTGDDTPTLNPSGGNVAGQAVRVLVKGGDLGGPIEQDGGRPWYLIRSSTVAALHIQGASLAESVVVNGAPTPDTVAGSEVELRFGWNNGSTSDLLSAGEFAWLTPESGVNMDISMDKTYAVTFLVTPSATQGNAPYHTNPDASAVESYIMPATETPNSSDIFANTWSSNPAVYGDNRLFMIQDGWTQVLSSGTYTSPIFDTHQSSPNYDEINWEQIAGGGTISMRVRTADNSDMSDAPDWSTIASLSGPSGLTVPNKRYVQFQAELNAGYNAWDTPKLKNVTINWSGINQINDIVVSYTTGPDMGIYEVEVDGNPLLKGLKASIEIYQYVPVFGGTSKRITSEITEEIEPRNSTL